MKTVKQLQAELNKERYDKTHAEVIIIHNDAQYSITSVNYNKDRNKVYITVSEKDDDKSN